MYVKGIHQYQKKKYIVEIPQAIKVTKQKPMLTAR